MQSNQLDNSECFTTCFMIYTHKRNKKKPNIYRVIKNKSFFFAIKVILNNECCYFETDYIFLKNREFVEFLACDYIYNKI